jgi:hypothetical protein
MATLPRVNYIPVAETSLANVDLTEPGSVTFPPGESNFPTTTDTFKVLKYEAATQEIVKQKLAQYHSLMVKITGGTGTEADLTALKGLMTDIRNHVLTEDDLNLMVDALTKIEEYLYTFLRHDLEAKAEALDVVLGDFVATLNDFMADLEAKYNNSPSNYPIPDQSILYSKTETRIQNAITYGEGTMGVISAAAQPAKPVGRSIIWIDTNMGDAD